MASSHNEPFYEWLCHSNFSFLTGASHPEDYVHTLSQLGYQGMGLCDYDGLYGSVRAHRALKHVEGSFRLFHGSEFHLRKDHHLPPVFRDTLVLYALNMKGYRRLCELITLSHREGKKEASLPLSQLQNGSLEGLVALLPMRGLVRLGSFEELKKRWLIYRELFGQNLYAIVSRHFTPSEDHWIKKTTMLSHQLEIPTLISQDCYFHHPSQKDLCDLVQAIRINKTVMESGAFLFANHQRCPQPLAVLKKTYQGHSFYQQSLKNSLELSERFDFSLAELRYQYPKEMVPEGLSSQEFLEQIVWQKASESYGTPLPARMKDLLTKELQLVRELHFADYFLTVWDIVRWAREQNILCQGRGSAANSAICYVLAITAADPFQYDLLFERFLSAERGDPPDIDVDFEHERREEVIQHIYSHYGRHRAAMVANVITFRSRGAMRETGKALGIPEKYLAEAAHQHSSRTHRTSSQQLLSSPSEDEIPLELWQSLSSRLKGFPRHMGLHSGGFVITQDHITDFVPREPATMVGRSVVQWAKDDLEALGFFKIDILALGMLTAIRKGFELIGKHHHIELSMNKIPKEDPLTYQMICAADTVGTFQIESRAQMSMLPRLKPRTFYDLVVQIGIIRPGPIQGGLIHPFLRRRQGLEPIRYAHPKLEPILQRTLGVPIFQEQIMRMAMAIGDFTPGEADALRKQIGSFALHKDLGDMVEKLKSGMQRHRIAPHFIEQTLGYLEGFAHYGFPESHALSFALIAYASSWLKCHYPAAFFAAILNSLPMGFYSAHTLLQTARRLGVQVKGICILKSSWDQTLEDEGHSIRLGFSRIKGLSKKRFLAYINQRDQKPPPCQLEALLKSTPLHRYELIALCASGALECFGINPREAIWICEALPYASLIEEDLYQPFAKEDRWHEVQRDFQSFGTTLKEHPVTLIKEDHWHYPIKKDQLIPSKDLPNLSQNLILTTFGMILVRQAPPTAKGMVFVTLEDEYGFMNIAFTPQVYARYRKLINDHSFLCLRGKLQLNGRSHSILVERVFDLQRPHAAVHRMSAKKNLPAKRALTSVRNYT